MIPPTDRTTHTKDDKNDQGAGLIGQVASPTAETEPRLNNRVCNYGTHKWGSWERKGAGHVRACRRCPTEESK